MEHSVDSQDSLNQLAGTDILTPVWDMNGMALLRDHREYHRAMHEAIEDMMKTGDRSKEFP
jgi:hypothetical protein